MTPRSLYVHDEADLLRQHQLPGEPSWRPYSAISHILKSDSTFQYIKNIQHTVEDWTWFLGKQVGVCVCVCVRVHVCMCTHTCVCVCVCAQLCPTLCDPTDCSLPGFSVHGMFQARILEWVATSFSWGSSWHRDQTHISGISCIGQWVLYHWATREAEKADTMSQTKIAGADDSHIPSQTPHHVHVVHSDFQQSKPPSSCERCLCSPFRLSAVRASIFLWKMSQASEFCFAHARDKSEMLENWADLPSPFTHSLVRLIQGHFCYVNHF